MRTGIIYSATNLINGKVYVGQTVETLNERKRKHFEKARNTKQQNKFIRALRKYKQKDWKWEVLVEDLESNLDLLEKSYIWGLSTYEFGYNSTRGGDYNPTKNPEVAKKVSIALTGIKRSEETRRKISLSKQGKNHPNFGRHRSEETKRKIGLAQIGKIISEETKHKLSLSKRGENHPMFGKHLPKETKIKISESNRGKKLSPETRNNIANTRSKTTYEITFPNGTIKIIKNLKKFCRENNLKDSAMYVVSQGKGNHHKGFKVKKI